MNIALVVLFVVALFGGVLLFLEIGRWIGRRGNVPEETPSLGALEGAVFGLMGLLVAFTFSGAAARFDTKRELVVKEANAIGTAWLRLDLLPDSAQQRLRPEFRNYVDERIAVYRSIPDLAAARLHIDRAAAMQNRIWSQAVAACRDAGSPATTSLVISSFNDMIDITTTRTVALQTHPPAVIFMLLFGVALASSLLAGYGNAAKPRSWIHILGFAAVLAITAYIILDLEYPRIGVIRLDAVDQLLAQLRQTMN